MSGSWININNTGKRIRALLLFFRHMLDKTIMAYADRSTFQHAHTTAFFLEYYRVLIFYLYIEIMLHYLSNYKKCVACNYHVITAREMRVKY